jgi:hypothetical protein
MQTDRATAVAQQLWAIARWSGGATLALALALNGAVKAQQPDAVTGPLIEVVTEGKGPSEKVIGFRLAKDAARHRLPDADVAALSQALVAGDRAREVERARDLGMQVLGLSAGGVAAIGTLAEHGLWLGSLSPANNALNNVGFMLALVQVARDAARGDDRAAATGSLKAYMSFAISRWGWGALQIGGVALFVTDVVLTQWQSGLTDIGVDVWSCRYTAWYKSNGRSVADWKVKAWELYLAAEGKGDQSYEVYIDGVLNGYVGLAFRDDLLATYGDCSASSFGEQANIREIIMGRHKAVLQKMLVARVMPEIADRAWQRQVQAQVALANKELMDPLNRRFILDVTAYGVEGAARVVMPLPAGGEWAGKLRPDGTFQAALTLYAVIKAGFPDTVRLETESGVEERKLMISGDKVSAIFGTPEVAMVSRYSLAEGAQSCTIKRIATDGSTTTEAGGAEASPDQTVDMGMLANGSWIVGRFSIEGGWANASPGVISGDKLALGAPLFDNIRSISGCSLGLFDKGKMAEMGCTIERYEMKAVNDRVTIERICTSAAKMDMVGAFAPMGDAAMQYFPMDGEAGKMAAEILKKSIENGGQSFDMNSIPGMPQLP